MLTIDIKASILCPACGQRSDNFGNPNVSHGVTLPDNVDSQLADLVLASFATETLQGSQCGNPACPDNSPRPRSFSIFGPPDILCIQLCRFIFTHNANGTVQSHKNNRRVRFGSWLDLSAYLEGQRPGASSLRYRLIAVAQQMGGLNTGHYVTMGKGPNGKWREMDDARVAAVRLTDATDPMKSGQRDNNITPYLLFWERVDEVVADI